MIYTHGCQLEASFTNFSCKLIVAMLLDSCQGDVSGSENIFQMMTFKKWLLALIPSLQQPAHSVCMIYFNKQLKSFLYVIPDKNVALVLLNQVWLLEQWGHHREDRINLKASIGIVIG